MHIRRLIALVIFLFSAFVGYVGYGILIQGSDGYTKLSGLIICGFAIGGVLLSLTVGLIQGKVFLKELQTLDLGPGLPLPRSWDRPILVGFFGLIGIGCFYVLGKALFTGTIDSVLGDVRIHFHQQPVAFIIQSAFWSGLGTAFIWISRRAARHNKNVRSKAVNARRVR